MSGFIAALKAGVQLMKRGDDDAYDRLSSRYSVAICLVFAFLISGGQYIGDPIDCWTPAEFSGQWTKYADQYCWVKNTYYVPMTQSIPDHDQRSGLEITYYQWTPIILAFQALLFVIPGLLWKVFSSGAGYDIHQIVLTCNKSDLLNPEKRDGVIAYVTSHLDRLLGYRREYRDGGLARMRQRVAEKGCMVGKRYGNYLFILYIVVKFFYIGVALLQLYALNIIIGSGYHLYGVQVISDLINNQGWEASPFFPRVTLCDFRIRKLGQNLHKYTVQCVLPYNLFNEKIYIFLWWWLVFVAAMSCIGVLVWLVTLLPKSNMRFVGKYLKVMNRLSGQSDKERKLVSEFTNRYLRQDGVFVLRMVSSHVNDLTAAEIICSLWDNFVAYRAKSVDDIPSKHDA
ncbi:innexin unc-9-like [Watersipora subatra]|uniref:innexin unc-9-like n=1 Tax=Watersipora subatra TaxID=2589382 RepID=UPI00355C2D2E